MKTNFSVSFDKKCNCIIVRFIGEINSFSMNEYLEEVSKMAKINNCKRIISDLSKASIKMSFHELFLTPQKVVIDKYDLSWKRAIIVKEINENAHFYETVARNQLMSVKLFTNEKDAKEWL